jgi:hypothetical protein
MFRKRLATELINNSHNKKRENVDGDQDMHGEDDMYMIDCNMQLQL